MTSPLSADASAKIPPSPSWSTIMMNRMYLMLTISVRVQKISEATPSTASPPGGSPGVWMASCMAYIGLVPISPKTIPIAAKAIATVAGDFPCFSFMPAGPLALISSYGVGDRALSHLMSLSYVIILYSIIDCIVRCNKAVGQPIGILGCSKLGIAPPRDNR